MKALCLVFAALLLIASPLFAAQTRCYSWEDCIGTIMGSYGNLVGEANVTGAQTGSQGSTLPDYTCPGAHSGCRYLHVAEDPHYSTPQAYVAYIENLQYGDVVTAGFYGYDITGSSPSLRVWAHYALNGDVTSYVASAIPSSPVPDYTAGTGWDLTEWTINFGIDGYPNGSEEALVIEARIYSTPATSDPDHTDYWIDDVCVTAPDHATITFPYNEPTGLDESSWGRIKTLFR